MQVAIIKNDPKDKARFDVPGKDSYKFSDTGAEVVVTSPARTTFFSQRHKDLDEIISMLDTFDIVLVEGLKTLPLPRISIFREKIDTDYFPFMDALAIDDSIDLISYDIPQNVAVLDLNDPDMVIEWILNNAMNRFQLNFKRNVGAVSEAIRKCAPKTLEEWKEYYFNNIKSKEHIINL
jgi:molybdopterin-guanine dinucleotide biosynthesis protein B